MPHVQRSALLPYPARQVYDLVTDVAAYPEFLPWCGGVEVTSASDTAMEAALQISGAGLKQWFRTRNTMIPGEAIEMQLVDGPFKRLHGGWRFTPLADDGCRIELSMDFEFKRGLASALIGPAFTRIANSLVDSFCQRAHELYGK